MWKRRINRVVGGFFCALLIGIQLSTAVCAQDMELYATAAVLMDAATGRVLYGKNADTPMAMASTTKIMTCITVLEKGNLEDTITVSGYAASMPKVKLYVKKGESYQVKDLLYSLMLESHNDAAVVLAEYIGKQYLPEKLRQKETRDYSVEESKQAVAAFAKVMNEKARELGCENTYFITPNGLDATESITLENGEVLQKEHCTTAAELAKIMSYCIKESEKRGDFLEITGRSSYSFAANGRSFLCANHNAFLNMMAGALSGKTGFTNKAGYCYVGALEREGRTFVVALLACGWPNNKSYKWSDTRKLMQYGVEHYFWKDFNAEDVRFDEKKLEAIPVEGGCTDILGNQAYVNVAVKEKEMLPGKQGRQEYEGLLLREDEEILVEYHCKDRLCAPVKKGELVGNIYYLVDEIIYKSEEIVTTEEIKKIDLFWCMKQVWERFAEGFEL